MFYSIKYSIKDIKVSVNQKKFTSPCYNQDFSKSAFQILFE